MFASTQRFRDAVALINNADEQKLPLLLSRILQRLHEKEKSFNASEEEQLKRMLRLSSMQLKTLLDACSFVFEQAGYFGGGAEVLLSHLSSAGVQESRCQSFARVWELEGLKYVQRVAERPFGAAKSLTDVKWKLNVRMSQDDQAGLREPTALVEFGLSDVDNLDPERLQLEFSKDELYSFFGKLDMVQDQLDVLQ